jgi:hypothetical protein
LFILMKNSITYNLDHIYLLIYTNFIFQGIDKIIVKIWFRLLKPSQTKILFRLVFAIII